VVIVRRDGEAWITTIAGPGDGAPTGSEGT
jgi:hypothetical protein